jgi:hypothetical protein
MPSIDTKMQLQSQYRQSVLREQVKCKHGNSPLYCLWCERVITPETDAVAALQRKFGLATPTLEDTETCTFDYFPEILGITRRQLIGLFELPVGIESRAVEKKILKSTLPIEARIAEIKQVSKQIEKRKKMIAKSEERIRSWSVHIQKIQVSRGERNPGDILDKATREKFKREEQKRISRCKEVISELRDRQSRLECLERRLASWGSLPEDFETVTTSEDVVVTFRDKFELSKRYLENHPDDSIEHFIAVLSEYDLLKDISRRLQNYPAIDRWRYLENEIIFQAIRWGLVQPAERIIKKYPWLDQVPSGRPEHYENDFEERMAIKTEGASIGGRIYSSGTRDGIPRPLESFDKMMDAGD